MTTEPTPLEQLTTLLDERADASEQWRKMLPTLRARSAGTSVALSELARTSPTDSRSTRDYVDIVIAAPSRDWAQDVTDRLRQALPLARVELGVPGAPLPEAPPPGYTVRCHVSLPGVSNGKAVAEARSALAKMTDLEVDYSESIDLIVVTPRG
jgi:hypothetical protein